MRVISNVSRPGNRRRSWPSTIAVILLGLVLGLWTAGVGAGVAKADSTPSFSATASAVPGIVVLGQSTVISVSATDLGGPLSNGIVYLEIYNAGVRVATKTWSAQTFTAGQTISNSFTYTPAAAGTHTMQVGVFGASWSPTYSWIGNAGTFTVQPANWTTVGNLSFVGSVTKPTLPAGQIQTANVSIKSSAALTGLIVSIKFLDSAGATLLEKSNSPVSFTAGEQKNFSVALGLRGDAPAGTYSIVLVVHTANYASTLVYHPNLATYQVTTITQPTYAVTPLPPNTLTMTSVKDGYLYGGPYFVQNNMWGITGLPAGSYSQSSGIGPVTANNSVSARWNWSYPDGPNEVKGYPAIGFGQKPGTPSTPGSNLPKLVDSIASAVSSWDVQSVYTGKGQLTYDLWLTRDAVQYSNFPSTPITHEIMLTVDSFGGYGVNRNPSWYVESVIIDGNTYRVWKADNFGPPMNWRFIVLQMVNPVRMPKGSVNFKNIFTYLKSAGLITGQEYLSSIEFGNEMQVGTGEVYVKDYKAQVQ